MTELHPWAMFPNGAGVHGGGLSFASLDEVGLDCVAKQRHHRADSVDVACGDWLAIAREGYDGPGQPFAKVV